MNKLVLFLLTGNFLVALGNKASFHSNSEAPEVAGTECNETECNETECNETESPYLASLQDSNLENVKHSVLVQTKTVNITSDLQVYPAYTAAPAAEGNYPAIVLIHSFKGFEPGYQTIVDRIAEDGYVVVAPFWQTYKVSPSDAEVEALIRNSIAYLKTRKDVDSERLGLTGFCAGGRYTMLFLPQIKEFKSGVAWYGFPYTGGSELQPSRPASLIDRLETAMLVIHGTRDQFSSITDIYRYAGELDASGKYFEMKVYQGELHGFMITENGELSESFVARDAYEEMINFFDRTLSNSTL